MQSNGTGGGVAKKLGGRALSLSLVWPRAFDGYQPAELQRRVKETTTKGQPSSSSN